MVRWSERRIPATVLESADANLISLVSDFTEIDQAILDHPESHIFLPCYSPRNTQRTCRMGNDYLTRWDNQICSYLKGFHVILDDLNKFSEL